MVIDGAKGVEPRTIKLMEVCRLRDTPIMTFINKLDREIRDPIEVLDEIEDILQIHCAPMNWPIDMGRQFKGVYDLVHDCIVEYRQGQGHHVYPYNIIEGLDSDAARALLGDAYDGYCEEIELVRGASYEFDEADYHNGTLTPVYFGTALGNFGIKQLLDGFASFSPEPQGRESNERLVAPDEDKFSGFVFKIQANMDPKHRDRIAFMRICSGRYEQGMRMHHLRLGKQLKVTDAVTFMAGDRTHAEEAYAGDIIGLHNHGTIQIGDTFTEGEKLKFKGIPNFAPELFRRVRVKDPLRSKQLDKGITQLAEEGATQAFFPLTKNQIVVGAVGVLQFDVVSYRLRDEYRAECVWEDASIFTARWVYCDDEKKLAEFKSRNEDNLALDGGGYLTYLAPSRVNLALAEERWPDIVFAHTREH